MVLADRVGAGNVSLSKPAPGSATADGRGHGSALLNTDGANVREAEAATARNDGGEGEDSDVDTGGGEGVAGMDWKEASGGEGETGTGAASSLRGVQSTSYSADGEKGSGWLGCAFSLVRKEAERRESVSKEGDGLEENVSLEYLLCVCAAPTRPRDER